MITAEHRLIAASERCGFYEKTLFLYNAFSMIIDAFCFKLLRADVPFISSSIGCHYDGHYLCASISIRRFFIPRKISCGAASSASVLMMIRAEQ